MKTSLFHPIKIDNLEFKNRIILSPPPALLTNQNGSPGDELIDYYQKLAETGACSIITEGVAINSSCISWQKQLCLTAANAINSFSRLVEKVRSKGALPFISLFHGGINSLDHKRTGVYGPSKLNLPDKKINELSHSAIDQIIAGYAEAANMAWRAGFSGIEILAADGSLPQQFLSPLTNTRSDEYSYARTFGSLFLYKIVAAVKAVTPDLTIICRLSLKDLKPGGTGLNSSIKIAADLEKLGIRIFHITEGLITRNPLKMHSSAGKNEPDAPFSEDCQIFKNETGLFTILSGKISTPKIAQSRLKKEVCDFISLGRTINRHKDWIKLASQDMEPWQTKCLRCEICLAATQGCPDKQY